MLDAYVKAHMEPEANYSRDCESTRYVKDLTYAVRWRNSSFRYMHDLLEEEEEPDSGTLALLRKTFDI
jgi:hypothetical protein